MQSLKPRSLAESFNAAIEGFIYVVKTQRNMRLHFLIAAAVLVISIYLHFSAIEILLICAAIAFVLVAEMINTAMEHLVDLLTETFHPAARVIKDVFAGAVLIATINAIVVGYLIFQNRMNLQIEVGLSRIRQSPYHLTFIALILVLSLVVLGKIIFHKGTPLRGGMPSGHSAIVFSCWTIISLLTENGLITLLTLMLCILVARSRMQSKTHTFWEVLAGSLLGILVTTIVFQLLT